MRASNKLVHVMISVFLAFMFLECPTVAKENDSTDSRTYEVLNIGGLFAIHGQAGKNQTSEPSACGPFRIGGFEELNAMLFAIDKVNEDESLLPGIKLQVKIEDTCSSIEVATEKSLNYTIINYQSIYECFGNHSAQDKPILAIVGERSSDISRAVTNLVGLFHIPVIGYGATSSSLTGVKYFTRTIAPDTFVTQTLIDILERFGWNYVILLYCDSEYGQFAAESFRERLRKEKKTICTAVDERISDDMTENSKTWQKIYKERRNTKVVIVFATIHDFSGFLQAAGKLGKGKVHLEEYIWLSTDIWNGQWQTTIEMTTMLKHAISVIPNQVFIKEFADFFHNARRKMKSLKQHSSFDESWFDEYNSLPKPNRSSFENSCIEWGSSEVSYVMDAVYTIAWALHSILNCNSTTKTCNKSQTNNFFKSELLKAIRDVNFQNNWTLNKVSFTRNGNPRNVKYTIVSFQEKEKCFVDIGEWDCIVNDNETCTGNLIMEDALVTVTTGNFLGVCGALCPPGQYKLVDKHFGSCCWQCKNCSKNSYSENPGSLACKNCKTDEWPTSNRTACAKVKPQKIILTENPAGIVLLCVNIIIIKILIAFVVLIIKYSQSKMKIFSDRLLCYTLLLGILMCNVVSIFVLTEDHKDHCLLMVILSKLGSTCTLGTIFIKTNDVYRTYKKKILRGDPRFLSEGLKVMVVICMVIIDVALLWFSINFEGKNRKTSTTVYFPTETGNTAYVHCGFIIDFISGEIFTVLEISFFWGLLLICTHQSYLTRKVTNNAHGLRYIFFGSLALSINAMTMILTQSFTDNKGNKKELMYSFYNLFFATVALVGTFLPKVDILVFHPEKDVLFDALRTTTIKNEKSMINMRERIKSVMESASPSGTREG